MQLGAIGLDVSRPAHAIPVTLDGAELYIALGDAVDLAKERQRLQQQLEMLTKQLDGVTQRLGNRDFRSKAPAEVVESETAKHTQLRTTIQRLNDHLAALA